MAGSLSQRATRRLIKLYSAPNTSAMYQPQMKLSTIPRQKLRQLSNSKPSKKIDSAECCTGKPGSKNQVGDEEKQTEAQSEGHNRDGARLADIELRSGPRPGHALHLAHVDALRFRYIIP